jgi:hypothetical protein
MRGREACREGGVGVFTGDSSGSLITRGLGHQLQVSGANQVKSSWREPSNSPDRVNKVFHICIETRNRYKTKVLREGQIRGGT